MFGRFVTENEVPALRGDARLCPDQALEIILRPPERRRPHAWGGRHILADELEQPADEALRCPVGNAYPPATAAHADEFARRLRMIRREHDATACQQGSTWNAKLNCNPRICACYVSSR